MKLAFGRGARRQIQLQERGEQVLCDQGGRHHKVSVQQPGFRPKYIYVLAGWLADRLVVPSNPVMALTLHVCQLSGVAALFSH